MTKLVIKKHKPLQVILAIVTLCIFLSLTTWVLLDKSHWLFIKSRFSGGQESKELWEINSRLDVENSELRKRVIKLEQMTLVDNQTATNLQEEIRNLQDEVYRLKGELEFYQGVMDSAREVEGLNVQGLQIVPLLQANNFRFKLILTHVTKSDKVAEGKIDIILEGIQGDSQKALNIQDLVLEGSLKPKYKFKHFMRLESTMIIPAGFIPHRVRVSLIPKETKLSKVEKIFEWQETNIIGNS